MIGLTNSISEMIAQLRLSDTSPKKINANVNMKLRFEVNNEMQSNTEEIARPNPQINGSARGSLGRHLVLRKLPRGTPMIPDIIAITPKTKDTLKI